MQTSVLSTMQPHVSMVSCFSTHLRAGYQTEVFADGLVFSSTFDFFVIVTVTVSKVILPFQVISHATSTPPGLSVQK